MDWQEITVTTTEKAAEAVANILVELGSGGVAIEDPTVIRDHLEKDNWDAHELPEELLKLQDVRVRAYFSADDKLAARLEDMKIRLTELNQHFMPGSVLAIDYSFISEEDWAQSWKAYYKPVEIGRRLVIKPSWEDYEATDGRVIIELDPGMAFGTGTHATTAACLEALEEVLKGGETIYDVGTGSGILAIAAAKLGAARVTAIDLDPVAVRVAAENVRMNGVADKVEVVEGNLLDMARDKVPLIVANIIADIIIRVSPAVRRHLTDGGIFIASGIIRDRWPEVKAALENCGFQLKDVRGEKEWITVIAEKG